jgi:pimeloyl-ACP methyl ester carboxylesterase
MQSAWIEQLGAGDWAGLWRTFNIEDREPLTPIEEANDPLAIAAAVAGSQRPTRYVDLAGIRCPSFHYVGDQDPIARHVRADARTLAAPVEVSPEATHLTAFANAEPAIAAVSSWLGPSESP